MGSRARERISFHTLASFFCALGDHLASTYHDCRAVEGREKVLTTAQVHKDLPGILKEYTKAVLRANLTSEKDIIMFSVNYFQYKCETSPAPATQQQ
ncbi:unnamed protein product [Scytosiphon promiscuus]